MRKNSERIVWCKEQPKGIRLIEPSDALFLDYIKTAEETLEVLMNIKDKSKIWLATTKYYCEYFAVYAVLLKIGIRCEIHDCTIAMCGLLEEKEVFPEGCRKTLEDDKQLRIDNQYYLRNTEVSFDYDNLLAFILCMKDIGHNLRYDKIISLRKILEQ